MKDLKKYISEGIFDEEDQIDDLDWVNVDFQSLIDSKTEDEFIRKTELLELHCKNKGGLVPMLGGLWLPMREVNKKYIMFYKGDVRRVRYGTKTQSYICNWNRTYVSNVQAPRGMRDYTHLQANNNKISEVYYIPDSLKKSYNKAIKTIQ